MAKYNIVKITAICKHSIDNKHAIDSKILFSKYIFIF